MSDTLMSKTVAILERYAGNLPAPVEGETRLSDLAIDHLDMPMIVLDLEEALDVHVTYDDEIETSATVADFVACLARRMKRQSRLVPRSTRNWMSPTGADAR